MVNIDKLYEIYIEALKIRKETIIKSRESFISRGAPAPSDCDALLGKCIEASDTLMGRLKSLQYVVEPKQVWVLYENYESCQSYCFEEHWIVQVIFGKTKIYVDPTIQQFQWAMLKKLPMVYIGAVLPNWMLSRKPGKDTLDKCGWDYFLDTGYIENDFNYWGYLKNKRNLEIQQGIKKKMAQANKS